ncbi:MAG: pilus assembly protein TadG-related protein [Pseudomonadota bacterium]
MSQSEQPNRQSTSNPAPHRKGGVLKALLSDASANTLAIGAAAMVPLVAMVGGGVDASRFYMAQSRLQAACDAGALAARRSMTDTNFTQTQQDLGNGFFDENYPDGTFGLTGLQRTFSGTSDGEVTGTASGKMPTSLMGIFGYDEFDLAVNCQADINISNTDIMFVVDVTGSMNCPDNTTSCTNGNNNNVEASNARIKGLRTAVMSFYDTVKVATSSSARVRYGVVPYASNVNVGSEIVAANSAWMASDAVFQSRWAKYDETPTYDEIGREATEVRNERNEDFIERIEEVIPNISKNRCRNREVPEDYIDYITHLGTHQGANSQRVEGNFRYTNYTDDNETIERGIAFWEFQRNGGGAARRCTVGWDVYRYTADIDFDLVETEGDPIITFDEWVYARIDTGSPPGGSNPVGAPGGWESVNIRNFYGSSRQGQIPVGSSGTMTTLSWDGCIEEAETVATSSLDPIPTGALDLNINLVPSNRDERWKPVINNIAWERRNGDGNTVTRDVASSERSSQSRPSYSCPKAAFRLAELEDTTTASTDGVMRTRKDLQNYVNSLQGRSNTYHDIGMLWGARFISPRGMFQSANESAPNGDAISRHIVFMTDGTLEPNREVYGTYGIERWSRRVSGDGETGSTRTAHRERLQAICRAARNENISVWAVAFGNFTNPTTGLPEVPQNMVDCATPGRAYVATNSTSLNNTFKEIAQKIAALRLTQ